MAKPISEPDRVSDLLQLALEAAKSVAWDWDVRSGHGAWSGDLQAIFGIPSTTYKDVDDFRRCVHAEDRELVWKAVTDAMERQAPYSGEFRIVRPDGSVRWVAARGRFHYSSKGEPECMLGIAVDVTERKTSEDALRRKELELSHAQRVAGVGSWQWDPESDTVTWSDELYRIADRDPKLPPPQFKEHPALFTVESWERLRQAVEEALRIGAPYELDVELVRPDGSTRWLIARGETERDAEGRIVRLLGTAQDITERRRVQETLRESEERLRLAARSGSMYAFDWDRASDVKVRSGEVGPILGLSSESGKAMRQETLTIIHPDDRARVEAAPDVCTPESPTYRVQYRVIRPDGSLVWLEKSGYSFFNEKGEMYRVVGMVADITERKLAEEALTTLRRRLIAAHEAERARISRDLHDDFGQRLALVLMSLNHLKRAAGHTDEDRDQIDNVVKQVGDISKGIRHLSHQLHSATLDYLGLVVALRGLCKELSQQQKVEIRFSHYDIPETVTPEISLCLFRVLQEALHNALKYSKVDRFEVDLRGTPGWIDLIIRDAGVGFDPVKAMKGKGLGLISIQERLKLLNGQLSIDSKQGHGTVVHARVPFALAEAQAAQT